MQLTKIGIVEDEFIIASDLRDSLRKLNYDVPPPCKNYEEAIRMFTNEKPDLAVLDIHLAGAKDGVDVAEYARQHLDIPLIFLTANSDVATLDRVKKVYPNAFLTKPFQKKDLYIAIELALSNFSQSKNGSAPSSTEESDNILIKDAIFIKEGQYHHKLAFNDVLYIEGEGAYITFHTDKKKFLVRGGIREYLEKMGNPKFLRVHRSYAVNLDKVDSINTTSLYINDKEIPISKSSRDELFNLIKLG